MDVLEVIDNRESQMKCASNSRGRETDHQEEDDPRLQVTLDAVDDDAFADVHNLDPRRLRVDDGLVALLEISNAAPVVLDGFLGVPSSVLEVRKEKLEVRKEMRLERKEGGNAHLETRA